MRVRATPLIVLSLLGLTSVASGQTSPTAPAQQPVASTTASPSSGEAEFGGRASSISGDAARFQRYRDVRNGPTIDRAQYQNVKQRWEFKASLDHAGYRDQRYTAGFNQYGKLKATFQWDQVPFFYSVDTRTAFTSPTAGV